LDPGRGDLKHLKSEGLVQTIPAVGEDRALMILTEKGRDVLETNRLSTIRQRELRSTAALRGHRGRSVVARGSRQA
jgi:DNA-binding PadR family transcriptional regulator